MRVRAAGICGRLNGRGVVRTGARGCERFCAADQRPGRANCELVPWSSRLLTRLCHRLATWSARGLRSGDRGSVDPPDVLPHDARHGVAQHRREAEFRSAGGLRPRARPEKARDERDHHDGGGERQRRSRGRQSPTIDANRVRGRLSAMGARGRVISRGRRLECALDGGGLLAPEIRRAGWLTGARSEWNELFTGPEPVAGKANDLVPWPSLLLSCLGLPIFPHPVDALFQPFLRRQRQCRPDRAVV